MEKYIEKEQIKSDINYVKDLIHEIRAEVTDGRSKDSCNQKVERESKCNFCEEKFPTKDELNLHVLTNHPVEKKSTLCDDKFHQNCQLEEDNTVKNFN